MRQRGQLVSVEATHAGESIEVVVHDFGRWDPSGSEHSRGRGLEIMRSLMDEVTIMPGAFGTDITMRRRLAAGTRG